MLSGIYKITNIKNGRFYFGSTNNFRIRFTYHLSKLRNNKHDNTFLQRDFNKCGEENFVFEKIQLIYDQDKLIQEEQNYLDEYWDGCKNCYNICKEAKSRKGVPVSQETKNKIRIKHIGKKMSLQARRNMSISKKNFLLNNKHLRIKEKHPMFGRTGHLNPFYGKKHNEQTIEKIKEKLKGTRIGNKNPAARAVIAIEIFTDSKKYFSTIKDAAKFYNISPASISMVLIGKTKIVKKKNITFIYGDKK